MANSKGISRDDQLDAIVDEFTARLREGQRPQIDQYLALHPDLADELADVLSAVLMVEDVRSEPPDSDVSLHQADLTQLGDYQIVGEIGRGGMGVVYEAVDESLGRRVALKMLSAASTSRPDQLLRFRREARAAARLEHPNIVPVYGVGQHDGHHYIAMQFIVGYGIDRVIRELRQQNLSDQDTAAGRTRTAGTAESKSGIRGGAGERPVDSTVVLAGDSTASVAGSITFYRNAARIAAEAAEALHYAHSERVIHRDIKPSNLMLDVEGKTWVTDFGLAKLETDEDLTQTGDIVGTIRYLAPERLKGWADPTSDIYSLGLTLYELVTLRPAFSAPDRATLLDQVAHAAPVPPRKVDERVPRDLETIILKASAREPAHRYRTADAFAADLRRFQEGKPILARPTSWHESAWLWSKRNPLVAGLAAGLVLSLVVGLATASWNLYRLDQINTRLTARNGELKQAKETAQQNADEAEARFQDALTAIDQFLTRVADSHLSRTPGTQKLRSELLNTALEFYRGYIVSHRDDATVQFETAEAWLRVAEITNMIGSMEEALQAAHEALPIAEQLHRTEQDSASKLLLGRAHSQAGVIAARTGGTAEATEHFETAIELLRAINSDAPTMDSGLKLAEVLGQLGSLCRRQGAPERGIVLMEESIAIGEDLQTTYGEADAIVSLIARSYGNLANLLVDSNRFDDGLAAMQQSRTLAEQLLEADPSHMGHHTLLQNSLSNEAVLHARQGHFEKALPLAEQSVAHSLQLRNWNPGVSEFRADLAQQYILLSSVQAELGLPDTRSTRNLALPILEELLEENPSALRFRLNLASLHNSAASDMLSAGEAPEVVVPRYETAREMALAVLKDDPKNGMARYLLSVVNGGLASCYDKLGDYDAALDAIERGLEDQRLPDLQSAFTAKRAQVLAHLGRREESLQVLQQMDGLPPNRPDTAYKVALAWAACVPLFLSDSELSETERDARVTECLTNALEQLRHSRDGGALQSQTAQESFRNDRDLDALREFVEFQEFAASLE